MAIPSGSGTEVLKRFYINNHSSTEATLLDGVADHIYTILSVSFCEMSAQNEILIHLVHDQPIGGKQTYVYNERIVLVGTDELRAVFSSSATVDIWGSYIDQDWS